MKTKQRRARGTGRRSWRAGLVALAGGMAVFAGTTAGNAQNPPVRVECVGGGDRCVALWEADLSFARQPRLGIYLMASPDRPGGVLVAGVSEEGPAKRAGMIFGDVIVRFAGHDLAQPVAEELDTADARRVMERNVERLLAVSGGDTADARSLENSLALHMSVPRAWSPERRLRSLLAHVEEGDTVEIGIERDGEALTFMVSPEVLPWPSFRVSTEAFMDTLASDSLQARLRAMTERIQTATRSLRERSRDLDDRSRDLADWSRNMDDWSLNFELRAPRADAWAWGSGFPDLDMDLVDLNPGLGAYFGTNEGVLVAEIAEDSPLGLAPGDVVTHVDGRKVDDAAELRRILASYRSGEEIAFAIRRDGEAITVIGQREGPSPPRPRPR